MKVVEYSRSLFVMPQSYDGVRPHHLLLSLCGLKLLSSTGIIKKISDAILSFTSSITESFIPLVQAGLVPDFLIRFGIRVQLVST